MNPCHGVLKLKLLDGSGIKSVVQRSQCPSTFQNFWYLLWLRKQPHWPGHRQFSPVDEGASWPFDLKLQNVYGMVATVKAPFGVRHFFLLFGRRDNLTMKPN